MGPKKTPAAAEPQEEGKNKRKTLHDRIGLVFPVARVKAYMKWKGTSKYISPESAVALAAGMEYFVSELLAITIDESKGKSITTRDLFMTIESDPEIKRFFDGAILRGSGVNTTLANAMRREKLRKLQASAAASAAASSSSGKGKKKTG